MTIPSALFRCLVAAAVVSLWHPLPAKAYNPATRSYFPVLSPPRSLLVAKTWSGTGATPIALSPSPEVARAEFILMESLAGVLLKQTNAQNIFIEPNVDHRMILQDLLKRRGVTYSYWSAPGTPWTLAARFQTNFHKGYVRCDLASNPDSLNIARMAAYKYEAVIVDAVAETNAISRGWTKVFECADKNDDWFHTNWWPTWPIRDLALEQNNNPALLGDVVCMNDYAAATGVPVFFDGASTSLRRAFLSEMPSDGLLLGWPLFDELSFTEENSRHDKSLVAANWSFNLALLSSFRDATHLPMAQTACPEGTVAETNVHYATFIFTDGDNVQWFHNAFLSSTNWWGSPARGLVPVGWGLSPCLRDLSPTIVERLYEEASITQPATNIFVAMSPIGYAYPSLMSAGARATNASRLSGYLRDLGLSSLVVLDKSGFETPSVYEPYLQQDTLNAIFYWDAFGDYAKYKGAVHWLAGKPVISAFTTLWGANGPVQVATALNQRTRNPSTTEGYSMVAVHAWSHTVESIRQCMAQLDPHVKVVTPDVFVALMSKNALPAAAEPVINIDLGNLSRAPYGIPAPPLTLSINNTLQMLDGSPSTRFSMGAAYGFVNMNFPATVAFPVDNSSLEFDLWGDASGARIRLELWSNQWGAFLYYDVELSFTGWRHFSLRLDGSDGLQVYNATREQIAGSMNIWQVSGSWNQKPGLFHLDNVRLIWRKPVSAGPPLQVVPEGALLRFQWPAQYSGFRLSSAPTLSGPWMMVTNTPQRMACELELHLSRPGGQAFYRLAQLGL